MYTFGSTELKVLRYTYQPPYAVRKRSEVDVIPTIENTTATSVMQDGGRSRLEAKMALYLASMAEYQVLYNAYMASTEQVFTDSAGVTMTCYIHELTPPSKITDSWIQCQMTLMEV